MIVLKDLFNAFTSSKVNSRLVAYNQANTAQNKTKMSADFHPYSMTDKKGRREKVLHQVNI